MDVHTWVDPASRRRAPAALSAMPPAVVATPAVGAPSGGHLG